MSKVHTYDIDGLNKAKLIRRNRRFETKIKKIQRSKIPNYYSKYFYKRSGYFFDDTIINKSYKYYTVPEKLKEIYHIKTVFDESSKFPKFIKVSDGFVNIPEHTERQLIKCEYVPREKPILKRIDTNSIKQKYRKIAARQLRRKSTLSIPKGSWYKRDYDVAWNID